MKKFDLSLWLKDKSRKVVTRTGEPVEIINHEVKGEYCIYAKATWQDGETFNICTTSKGEAYKGEETAYDLFFADEEEELTEFEEQLASILFDREYEGKTNTEDDIEKGMLPYRLAAKEYSSELLDLARKEIVDKLSDDSFAIDFAISVGKQDALKSLPKWKKVDSNPAKFKYNLQGKRLYKDGEYYIELSDLETLPKEE